MPRRSQSPRRHSPPRRSRRSPSPGRSRRDDYGESRYSRDRDSRAPRGSRDDRRDDKRDDYRRDRRRPREDDRRERRDDRGSRRLDEGDRNAREHQRDGLDSDARRSRPRSTSQSRSPSPEEDKAKPNFANSGLLAAATNTVKHGDGTSTLLKYNEPPEARKPTLSWRLYVFKGEEQVGQLGFLPTLLFMFNHAIRSTSPASAECIFDWT